MAKPKGSNGSGITDGLVVIRDTRAEGKELTKALAVYSKGALNNSSQIYLNILRRGSNKPESDADIGDLFLGYAQAQRAIKAYHRVVRLNPRKAWYRLRLARIYWTLGMFQEAILHFEKACELMPYEPFYRFELADAYLSLGQVNEAVLQLEQVVDDAPHDDYYHVRLVAAYLRAGLLNNALLTMEKVIKLCPYNASYHCLLGWLYMKMNQKERAKFHLRYRCRLDQYDLDFLQRFQRFCNGTLRTTVKS